MSKLCPTCERTYDDASIYCPADGAALQIPDIGDDLVGRVLAGRYLVLEKLGEGGMGRVYRARHIRLPQEVAIKVLGARLVGDWDAIARFNREATSASRIDSEHVARVYDFGDAGDGQLYIAMELVGGRSLEVIIREEGPLDAERTGRLVRQIADGLDAAHQVGIVHRDLKPENVIVSVGPDGAECAKLVDFGIAKALDAEDSPEPKLTQTGFVIGTPDFMSPEQITGGPLDARSDVYALATVAFECLTGTLPFASDAPGGVMMARLVSPARPLSAAQPLASWPPAVQEVLDQGLARDPALRPAGAGAFARALAEALSAPCPTAGWEADAPPAEQPVGASREVSGTVEPPAVAEASTPSPTPPAEPPIDRPAPTASPGSPAIRVRQAGARRSVVRAVSAGALGVVALSGTLAVAVAFARGRVERADTPRQTTSDAPAARGAAPLPPRDRRDPVGRPPPTRERTVRRRPPASSTPPRTDSLGRPDRAPPPPDPTPTPPDVTAARATLDSIVTAFAEANGDQVSLVAGRAVPALRALLVRLRVGDDSVRAMAHLAIAHGALGEVAQACAVVRTVDALARTAAHRALIGRLRADLACRD